MKQVVLFALFSILVFTSNAQDSVKTYLEPCTLVVSDEVRHFHELSIVYGWEKLGIHPEFPVGDWRHIWHVAFLDENFNEIPHPKFIWVKRARVLSADTIKNRHYMAFGVMQPEDYNRMKSSASDSSWTHINYFNFDTQPVYMGNYSPDREGGYTSLKEVEKRFVDWVVKKYTCINPEEQKWQSRMFYKKGSKELYVYDWVALYVTWNKTHKNDKLEAY